MNSLPQHTLPLANTSALTPWGRGFAASTTGWREALAAAAHSAGPAAGSQQAPGQVLRPAPQLHEEAGETGPAFAVPRMESVSRAPPAVHIAGATTDDRGLAAPSAVALPLESSAREARRAPEDGAVARPATRAPSPRVRVDSEQVHVHVERHASGLAVWLGVPRHVDPTSLASLLLALRAPGPGGLAAARVTCNGQLLYASIDPPQEMP